MSAPINCFAELAGQTRSGDLRARAAIQRELAPCLQRIVALALDPSVAPSPLHRRIRALARQLHKSRPVDTVAGQQMAESLCQRVVNRLAPTDTTAPAWMGTRAG